MANAPSLIMLGGWGFTDLRVELLVCWLLAPLAWLVVFLRVKKLVWKFWEWAGKVSSRVRGLPAIIARGGTSKGVFLDGRALTAHLGFPRGITVASIFAPRRPNRSVVSPDITETLRGRLRDRVTRCVLQTFSNDAALPDASGAQLDGLGGSTSSTSKVVILEPRRAEVPIVDYVFGQVSTTLPQVDWGTACGNLASAIPVVTEAFGFAGCTTTIGENYECTRVWQVNREYPLELVPTKSLVAIAGVPGKAPGVVVNFLLGDKYKEDELLLRGAGGGGGNKLLPAAGGAARIRLRVDDFEKKKKIELDATVLDGAVVSVFVRAAEAGFALPGDHGAEGVVGGRWVSGEEQIKRIDAIRKAAAESCGVPDWGPSSARVVWVGVSKTTTDKARTLLSACVSAPGRTRHHAFTGTGAVNLGIAAAVPGTVVSDELRSACEQDDHFLVAGAGAAEKSRTMCLTFVHPGGPMEVRAEIRKDEGGAWICESAGFVPALLDSALRDRWRFLCDGKKGSSARGETGCKADFHPGFVRKLGKRHLLQYSPNRGGKRILGKPQRQLYSEVRPWDFSRIKDLESETLLEAESIAELADRFRFRHEAEDCLPGFGIRASSANSSGGEVEVDVQELLEQPGTTRTSSQHQDEITSNTDGDHARHRNRTTADTQSNTIRVLLNLHPVAELHAVLVPPGLNFQYLDDRDAWETAASLSALSEVFHLYFNSLGAGASVNHLHFQAWVPPLPLPIDAFLANNDGPRGELLGDTSRTLTFGQSSQSGLVERVELRMELVADWPLTTNGTGGLKKMLCEDKPLADSSDNSLFSFPQRVLLRKSFEYIQRLLRANVPHNVFLYPKLRQILVAVRDFDNTQTVDPFGTQVAALEALGYWILPMKRDYDRYTTENLDGLLQKVSLREIAKKLMWELDEV
eukprot:g9313.t1